MTNTTPSKNREYITTMVYTMGTEISPTILYHVTMKECNRLRDVGWVEVLISLQHVGEKLSIRYTGIPTEKI
jgi:hypothetical protein